MTTPAHSPQLPQEGQPVETVVTVSHFKQGAGLGCA